ncbi:MAG: tryptophan synthase subunit alpha [Elusimicrobiota bacterium]|nr:MAG: tryptophan synthase subunit alpha [Elusimicrobiota bacterium]
MPFLVAGDPTLAQSLVAAKLLAAAGADVLEVGVPFSDPVADGPVIQAAGQRALAKGMSLKKAIGFVAALRADGVTIPVVLFTYLNPILRMGTEAFARACKKAEATGVLIVDLPAEDSTETEGILKKHGLELVLLASPTTTDERLKLIAKANGTAIYYVSREGVTGVRKGLALNIADRLKHVRRMTKKPLMVGFGVAEASQARALALHADGVVVGSALVRANYEGGPGAVRRLAKKLIGALEI